jgi:hypothetical protein
VNERIRVPPAARILPGKRQGGLQVADLAAKFKFDFELFPVGSGCDVSKNKQAF